MSDDEKEYDLLSKIENEMQIIERGMVSLEKMYSHSLEAVENGGKPMDSEMQDLNAGLKAKFRRLKLKLESLSNGSNRSEAAKLMIRLKKDAKIFEEAKELYRSQAAGNGSFSGPVKKPSREINDYDQEVKIKLT
jgi:hypothetical protein